jgi:putative nucleotidyltransferase with HDIG domain
MAVTIKVIFVDDEPNVLTALRRMLRSKQDSWDMTFVESGQAALDVLLEKNEMDVIVSDIRMPGMDGAELFTHVKDKYPGTIRIALSGQVDINEVMRSIRSVHQYISKPCNGDALITKIESAVRSRAVLTDPNLIELITEIDALPVVPKVLQDIQTELARDEPSIDVIAECITHDVGMVAKILNLINSPYFGLPTHVDSIHKAITMLGLDTVKTMVLCNHLFETYNTKALPGFSLNKLWDHCFRVSNIARLIAEYEGADINVITGCRMAGLLHDVGKLILANYFPNRYKQILKIAKEEGGPICDIEEITFGTTHAKVGAYLMGLWGVDGDIVHGIGFHHEYNKMDMSVAMFLSVANVIDHNLMIFNPKYTKVRINESLGLLIRDNHLAEKWIQHLKDHWCGVDNQCSIDEQSIQELFG